MKADKILGRFYLTRRAKRYLEALAATGHRTQSATVEMLIMKEMARMTGTDTEKGTTGSGGQGATTPAPSVRNPMRTVMTRTPSVQAASMNVWSKK